MRSTPMRPAANNTAAYIAEFLAVAAELGVRAEVNLFVGGCEARIAAQVRKGTRAKALVMEGT